MFPPEYQFEAALSSLREVLVFGENIRKLSKRAVLLALLLPAAGAFVQAGSVTFDFNSLSDTATIAQIEAYMDGALLAKNCIGCSVIVSAGTYADRTYNGDGHVVGPGNGSASLTLGDTDGANASNSASTFNTSTSYDTFLANTSDKSAQTRSQITLDFVGFTINGTVGFDYEIFPDGTVNQPPDFKFEAGTNTSGTDPAVTSFGTMGTRSGVTPGTTDGTSVYSPNSLSSTKKNKPELTESSAQYIGTWSGSLSGVTELDFIDWPATIGIDNLEVSWNTPSSVPEPGSLVLLASAVAGLALSLKRRHRKS